MFILAAIALELLALFLISNRILKTLYASLYLLFRNKHVCIGIVTFLYLPGTVIHELAHLISAEVMRVPTGEISFTPHIETQPDGSDYVVAGHVKIAETDLFRRYIVGLAPLPAGIFFLGLIIWIFQQYWGGITDIKLQIGFVLLISYLLFTVSNSMFSSKKDLEGFIFFGPLLFLIGLGAYFLGLRVSLTGPNLMKLLEIAAGVSRALGIVIGINIVILLINRLFLHGILKATRQQIVEK